MSTYLVHLFAAGLETELFYSKAAWEAGSHLPHTRKEAEMRKQSRSRRLYISFILALCLKVFAMLDYFVRIFQYGIDLKFNSKMRIFENRDVLSRDVTLYKTICSLKLNILGCSVYHPNIMVQTQVEETYSPKRGRVTWIERNVVFWSLIAT